LKAEVEVVASWGQLEPSVEEKDRAELEEMEAEEAHELHKKQPNRGNAKVS